MIGLQWTPKKFFWWWYYVFFSYAYFTYYGMMSVGLTPNHQIAAVVASFFYQIWNLFSGYLITRPVSQLLLKKSCHLSPLVSCDLANISCKLIRIRHHGLKWTGAGRYSKCCDMDGVETIVRSEFVT
jgi:hypothetical protein